MLFAPIQLLLIFRTIELEYFDQSSYQGVPVYLYHPAKSMNNIELQRELGFCNPNTPVYFNNTYIQSKGCLPIGLMDVSSCLPGNPNIYMSQPHFSGSPAALREALIGMREPNSKNDGTEIGIEVCRFCAYVDMFILVTRIFLDKTIFCTHFLCA